MFPTESIRPLWATIGTFAGSTLWFIGMVLLFLAGIMLFRAGKHPSTRGLRLSGLALIAFMPLSAFGSLLHEVVTYPALAQELSPFANHLIAVVFSVIGGILDLTLFAMFFAGSLKAARGARGLTTTAAVSQEAAQPLAQPVAKPAAQPLAQPVARPVAQPAAQPPRTVGRPVGTAAGAAPVAAPVAAAKPDLSNLIPKGPYARPTSVRTLVEPNRPARLPQLSLTRDDDALEDTQETALASLPYLADEDDDDVRREPTLLEFQMARPRPQETV